MRQVRKLAPCVALFIGLPALPLLPSFSAAQSKASVATPDPSLSRERTLLDEVNAARKAGDYALARAAARELVTQLFARTQAEQGPAWLELVNLAGYAAFDAEDHHTAHVAWKRVYDVRSASFPDEHPDVQAARSNLAVTMKRLGDLAGARALEERTLEIYERTLSDDRTEVQRARFNLAATIKQMGDLAGARVLEEQLLEAFSRRLPEDHPDLQALRGNLAVTLRQLGDLAGARVLEEQVVAVFSRILPDDHPDLQLARSNLGGTLLELGELAAARALFETVLEVRTRTLPSDHPDLPASWQNLAVTYERLGDLAGAHALHGKVLEARARILPDDHPDLQRARLNFADTLRQVGDAARSRSLCEQALEVLSRTFPDDHPDVQIARHSLAIACLAEGDLAGARLLFEQLLDVRSRTLPDDHPYVQRVRQNLASTVWFQGEFAGAHALFEKVLEVHERTLAEDHRDVQRARLNLAMTKRELGDLGAARALEERVLELCSRTLADDHPDLQAARQSLAATLEGLGDLAGALALQEKVLEVRARTLPDEHPELQIARFNVAGTLAGLEAMSRRGAHASEAVLGDSEPAPDRILALVRDASRAEMARARSSILSVSAREAEERCVAQRPHLDLAISFALGFGCFERARAIDADVFALAETTRGAAVATSGFARSASGSERSRELREKLRSASVELATLAQRGTTTAEFQRAREERESVERELSKLGLRDGGTRGSANPVDARGVAASLGPRDAVIAFRRFKHWTLSVAAPVGTQGVTVPTSATVESLSAFVVRPARSDGLGASGPAIDLLDLGPIADVECAVRSWRESLGIAAGRGVSAVERTETDDLRMRGADLCRLVFDPMRDALGNPERIVVVLDDVLHLVAFDALPSGTEDGRLLGDEFRIETRTTLGELLDPAPSKSGPNELLAVGGVAYAPEDSRVPAPARGMLRGSAWAAGFTTLPATLPEVEGVRRFFLDGFGVSASQQILTELSATKDALVAAAPRARWLHVATHGWFAPESVRSWSDPEPLDAHTGLAQRATGGEQVRGMSPMLLCGLAFAGANLAEDALGRAPGLLTADELSTLDLSGCELAVLSACDTNVGERRAGQGVASLQRALQMAGARSVITSLWKVPDEATKELMLDFYRRLWVEKKPKAQALWEAKTTLREARDERGAPKYATSDWAAWVLTGAPD